VENKNPSPPLGPLYLPNIYGIISCASVSPLIHFNFYSVVQFALHAACTLESRTSSNILIHALHCLLVVVKGTKDGPTAVLLVFYNVESILLTEPCSVGVSLAGCLC
jgi:hypothetical protein